MRRGRNSLPDLLCGLPRRRGPGNPALGAPNLTNGIWLYGGSEEQIAHTLRAGRNGMMPAFKDTLSEDKIHILAAYVYGLNQQQ